MWESRRQPAKTGVVNITAGLKIRTEEQQVQPQTFHTTYQLCFCCYLWLFSFVRYSNIKYPEFCNREFQVSQPQNLSQVHQP